TLEGQFSFPVSDGQTVSRFALDLNGKLRDAVVVDKSMARATFEAIMRKGVDPALLEWTRDNAFKTRIYPIMPRSTRRILIAYEQDLSQGADGLQYTLPIAVDDTIDAFSWDVSVAAFGSVPQLSGNSTEDVSFSSRGRQFISSVKRTKFLIAQPFVIDVPVVPAAQVITVNDHGGDVFASVVVAGPKNIVQTTARLLPSSITIAWDASLSGAKRDHEKVLQFFGAYFAKNRNVAVNLHVFAHEMIREQRFTVSEGRWDDLRRTLQSMVYDGATQLGTTPFTRFRSELTFLVSDGVSTFGSHKPEMGSTPVMGLIASPLADIDLMRALCARTGGGVYDLRVTGVDDALTSIFTSRLKLASVRVIDGSMESVYPNAIVEAGLCNTIVGRLTSPSATLELTYSLNGSIVERREIVVNAPEYRTDGLTAARQWAQQELASLAGDRKTNEGAIKQIGMRFGIVTAGTSLLVLETLNDYVQYEIEPPASEPELLAQWKQKMGMRPPTFVESPAARVAHLASLVSTWKTWYEKTFEGKKKEHLSKKSMGEGAAMSDDAPHIDEFISLEPMARSADLGSARVVSSASPSTVARGSRALSLESTASLSPTVVHRLDATEIEFDADALESSETQTLGTFNHVTRDVWARALQQNTKESIYQWYLANRDKYNLNTGFYLDVSDALRDKGLRTEALRVLSNLAELEGEN
ncbi:MAG: hypothetical protein H7X70_04040, partial [Candidatus Kapabacteria bacterium]|nr:hypothetical protein [Candidatus Kapabacteria bacterium]